MSEVQAINTSPEQAIDQHFADVKGDAVEAVKKALSDAQNDNGEAQEKEAPKVVEKAKPANDNEEPQEQETEEQKLSVKEILRERTRERKERERLKSERESYESAQRELHNLKSELERERAWFQELRRSPEKAVAAAGWKPDEFILDIANLDTPEGQTARQLRQLQEENKHLRSSFEQWEQRQKQQAEEAQQWAHQQAKAQVEQEFVSVALDAEKFPSLARAYGFRQSSLVREAHEIGAEYHRRTGVWASHEEIAQYLESLISGEAHASSKNGAQQQARSSGKSPQLRGQGNARPLNTSAASERRTIASDDAEGMSEDDRIAAAKAAVRATLRDRA